MSLHRVLWIAFLTLVIPGCASAPAQLSKSDMAALQAVPITVVYVDRRAPLGIIVSGAQPGEIRALSAYQVFRGQLEQYHDAIGGLSLQDVEYTAAQEALGKIPWLRDANWKRVPASSASDYHRTVAQQAGTRAVIILTPGAAIYSNVDRLVLSFDIEIYTRDTAGVLVPAKLASGAVGAAGTLGPAETGISLPQTVVQDHLDRLFADDAHEFRQALQTLLPELKNGLIYYFTGAGDVTPTATPFEIGQSLAY